MTSSLLKSCYKEKTVEKYRLYAGWIRLGIVHNLLWGEGDLCEEGAWIVMFTKTGGGGQFFPQYGGGVF